VGGIQKEKLDKDQSTKENYRIQRKSLYSNIGNELDMLQNMISRQNKSLSPKNKLITKRNLQVFDNRFSNVNITLKITLLCP